MSLITNKRSFRLEQIVMSILQSGRMPSSAELKKIIRKNEELSSSSEPALINKKFQFFNTLDPDGINDFIDEYRLDLMAIRKTIDDGWSSLEEILAKSVAFTDIYDQAKVIEKAAISSMSSIEEADLFYTVKNISDGLGASDWDLSLSSDVIMDKEAGTISLAKTSFKNINKSEIESVSSRVYSLDPEIKLSSLQSIGFARDILFDNNILNRYTQYISSTEKDGTVVQELEISLYDSAINSILNEISVFVYSKNDVVVNIYTSYDEFNYEYFGSSVGNSKITVYGRPVNVKNIKIEIYKNKYDDMINGKPTYIFDIGEISLVKASYPSNGYVVSNTIENTNDIANIKVDYIGEQKDSVSLYIADDIEGATSKDDFRWRKISNDVSWLSKPRVEKQTLHISTPTKYLYGPGLNTDLWAILETEDNVLYVDEGVDQFEVRYKVAQYATTLNLSRYDFNLNAANDSVINLGDNIALEPSLYDSEQDQTYNPNYFHLSTKIHSQFNTNINMYINIPYAKKEIFINGVKITSMLKANNISIPVSTGENILEILVLKNITETGTVTIINKEAANIAINKMEVTDSDSIDSSIPRAAKHNNKLLVNRYSKDKTYTIFTSSNTSPINSNYRLMAELNLTESGISPSIRQMIVRTAS